MKIQSTILLASWSLLVGSSLTFAEKVDFSLKFEPGQTYINETTMDQGMTMTMAGQEIATTSKMKMMTYQNVTQADEGLKVEQGTSVMKIDINTAGMDMNFDSENPAGPLAATMSPLLDAKTIVLLDAEGNISKVEAPAIPGMEMMGMGKKELELAARSAFDLYPNREIAEGGKWTSTTEMPLGGLTQKPVELSYEMTFEKMVEQDGKQLAKVLLTGTVESDDENLTIKSKKIDGTILFDSEVGQAHEITITMNLEMSLPAGIPAQEGAPAMMPISTTTTSRLVEVKPTAK